MSPRPSGIFGGFRLLFQLHKLRPDVVHTWMYHSDLVGGVAARLLGIRALIWSLRHSNLDRDKNKGSTLLVVKVCALMSDFLPARILSCSTRAELVHVGTGYPAAKIQVVPNGFDLARFRPDAAARAGIRAELGLSSDALVVGVVARFDVQKNHLGFVQAASIVRRALPNVVFVLVGQGIDRSNVRLVKAFRNAELEDGVYLLGRRDDIPQLMAAFDVLASPSLGEAFPNVLGEAMACGVPCVVTDVGDSAEIIGDTGRVVPPGNMCELAAQIIGLLKLERAERQRLGQSARMRIGEYYEIGKVVAQYEQTYLDVSSAIRGCRESA
jgi:glycosyltransferase involved in cell wall biosynthesis